MKCPNCSAECSDQSLECDFCGHPFVDAAEQAVPPVAVVPPVVMEMPQPVAMAPEPVPPPANSYQNIPPSAPEEISAVPNNMTFAIVTTILSTIANLLGCCCFPVSLATGIAAIVYASKVDKLLQGGDPRAAEAAAKSAKMWCWVTTVLGIIFGLLFIVSFVMQMMGFADANYLEDLRKQLEAGR